MRCFLRRAFTLAAAVSAVLLLGVCVLWVRGYWANDRFGFARPRCVMVSSMTSHLEVIYALPLSRDGWWFHTAWPPLTYYGLGLEGFYFEHTRTAAFDQTMLIAPSWAFCLLFLLLPIVRIVLFRKLRQRQAIGLCRHCGYDLRATLGRCPECGVVPGHDRLLVK